jgi:hypothetical protein
MKNFPLIATLAFLICCNPAVDSVNRERFGDFKLCDNGLVYDSATMVKLKKVIDSLHLRCETSPPKQFRSLDQGYGDYIDTFADSAEAHEVMAHPMTIEKLQKMFPSAKVLRNVWIAKERMNLFGEKTIRYASNIAPAWLRVPDVAIHDKSTGWVFSYHYPFLRGIYLKKLTSMQIPAEYATLIRYVDCIIDTTTTIFSPADTPRLDAIPDSLSKIKEYVDLVSDFEPAPEETKESADEEERRRRWDEYAAAVEGWYNRRLAALDRKMQNPVNMKLLDDAVAEAITHRHDFSLDEYAVRYLSPERALSLERSSRPLRTCGADMWPTRYTREICKLAVRANQWEIFLRAHLDVMNDHFYQYEPSDTSTRRKTYVRELDQMGVNSMKLSIGACLSSRDVNIVHYQGSTAVMARGLTESANQTSAVTLLLAMIEDKRLDLYNRTAMAQLLIFYNRESMKTPAYQRNLEGINRAIATLPEMVQKSLTAKMTEQL